MKLRVSGHFIDGGGGALAIVVWAPPSDRPCRFAVLHVPPSFDEMNKSRRMAALQARAFARLGAIVVLLDPRGTGDSAGAHAEATWAGWRDDVRSAWDWLGAEAEVPRVLWGTRLGALLAADIVSTCVLSPDALLLWQPVASGRTFLNQFLRVAVAQQLTANGGGADMQSLRSALEAGSTIEVAGYDVSAELYAQAGAVQMARLAAPACPIVWRETSADAAPAVTPAASDVIDTWKRNGAAIDVAAVGGASFWATQEITEAPALIETTSASLAVMFAASEASR